MINTRSVFLIGCLLFVGCKGCIEDAPASSQDATVDATVDAVADVTTNDAAPTPCHDASVDASETSLVPGC